MAAVSGVTASKMNGITLGSGGGGWGSSSVVLPTTEATADSNTFVVEMTGGASANETGVGGGLTGADLVWTQVGGIPAASDGLRTLAGDDYFTVTQTFLETMLGQSTWTIMYQMKNWVNGGVFTFITDSGQTYRLENHNLMTNSKSVNLAGPLANKDGWFVISVSGTKLFSGFSIGETAPTRIDDLKDSVVYHESCHSNDWSAVPALNNRWIIGYSSAALGAAFDLGTCVISKLALGFPA